MMLISGLVGVVEVAVSLALLTPAADLAVDLIDCPFFADSFAGSAYSD